MSKEIHLLTTEVDKMKLHCTTNKCSYFIQTFSIYIEERFVNNDVSIMSTLKGELCKSHTRTLSCLMSGGRELCQRICQHGCCVNYGVVRLESKEPNLDIVGRMHRVSNVLYFIRKRFHVSYSSFLFVCFRFL